MAIGRRTDKCLRDYRGQEWGIVTGDRGRVNLQKVVFQKKTAVIYVWVSGRFVIFFTSVMSSFRIVSSVSAVRT